MDRPCKACRLPRRRRFAGLLAAAALASCTPREGAPDPPPAPAEGPPPAASIAFTLPAADLLPEGIARDPRDGSFYLSSVRHRKVLRRGPDGRWEDFVPAAFEGLLGTAGLAIDPDRDLLWAVGVRAPQTLGPVGEDERTGLWAFRLADGTLAHRLLVADDAQHFLNDVTVSPDGRVFATDTAAGAVWEALPGEDRLVLFAESRAIAGANGITASLDATSLFVAHRTGIARLPLDGSAGQQLGESLRGVDGLEGLPGGLLAVQNQSGFNRILKIRLGTGGAPVRTVVLVDDHPAFDLPTSCTLGDGEAWCIAASHLLRPVGEIGDLEPAAVLHLPRQLLAPAADGGEG